MLLAPRNLSRLSATVGLFTRYGLVDFAKRQGLQQIAPEPDAEGEAPDDRPAATKAAAFRKRLVELGPAYVKLGQILSTRPDLLPAPYITELETLQDDVPGLPFDTIRDTVEAELGARLSKLFLTFDVAPLGTASLGQVHAAELRDGQSVVVKVQRPDIREQLADDIAFFRDLAGFLTAHTDAGARVDLVGVIAQLERALVEELDYRVEARNAATLRRSLAEFPRMLIPRVIEGYSTERVLTMERIRGEKIDAISPLVRVEHDLRPVAEDLTRAYLKQITIDGHFHADPHPGNVFVVLPDRQNPQTPAEKRRDNRRGVPREGMTPLSRIEQQAMSEAPRVPDDVDVRLALIDFGMTARLSPRLRDQVVRLLMSVADNRGDEAADVLIEVGDELPGFDRQAYTRDIAGLLARQYDAAVAEVQTGAVLYEVINISFREGLRLPAELTLLAKALFNLDSLTRRIDPTFTPIETIREYGQKISTERARRDLHPRHLIKLLGESADLAMALPHRLDLITQRMANNELEFRHDVPQLARMMEAMQKVANRIFSGLVLAGLLVASAMLLPHRRSLGTAGFVLAGVIGVWMVLSILWSDRKRRGD